MSSILAGRFGELIRRKLVSEGKASIKFYALGKDRSTGVEYLVPVSFMSERVLQKWYWMKAESNGCPNQLNPIAVNYIPYHISFNHPIFLPMQFF